MGAQAGPHVSVEGWGPGVQRDEVVGECDARGLLLGAGRVLLGSEPAPAHAHIPALPSVACSPPALPGLPWAGLALKAVE